MAQHPESTPVFTSSKSNHLPKDSSTAQQKPAPAAPAKKVLETYKKVRILGKGSFGKAFLVICGSDGVSQKNFLESYKLIMFLSCCMQSHAVVKKIDIKKMSEDDK